MKTLYGLNFMSTWELLSIVLLIVFCLCLCRAFEGITSHCPPYEYHSRRLSTVACSLRVFVRDAISLAPISFLPYICVVWLFSLCPLELSAFSGVYGLRCRSGWCRFLSTTRNETLWKQSVYALLLIS